MVLQEPVEEKKEQRVAPLSQSAEPLQPNKNVGFEPDYNLIDMSGAAKAL